MLNETVTETINALTPSGVVWWMKWLMIFGFFWILQTIFKTGVQLVYLAVYLIASVVFLFKKIIKRKSWGEI